MQQTASSVSGQYHTDQMGFRTRYFRDEIPTWKAFGSLGMIWILSGWFTGLIPKLACPSHLAKDKRQQLDGANGCGRLKWKDNYRLMLSFDQEQRPENKIIGSL